MLQSSADDKVQPNKGPSVTVEKAGFRAGRATPEDRYPRLLDAIIAVYEETGDWPSIEQYRNERPGWGPSVSRAYQLEAFDGWREAVEDAKERYRDEE
ncbi:hypothetical protein GCM10009037_29990 [Halarchaeum grantii]|uniref:Uncharacterized protein n=1 Tax=Halarchaeum grantii TaxID=1193105 RepID=A0A830FGG3_9EURY|nr:hypothetical protein [Halarchaeum grantii]GGL44584.1 hypothetical protein GCM10009037_29990 [Halarchaeum grantii]